MNGGPRAGDAGACVAFADVQRVLALFTQGILGRHLHLKPFEASAGDGRGRRIATDGLSIHLPAQIGHFASRRHNRGAYRIAVLHQIGYLENGTFEFNLAIAAHSMRVPDMAPASRAPARHILRLVPTRPRSDLERFIGAWPRPALLRRVFVAIEDLRIDMAMRRRYPGVRGDLDRVLAHALAARPAVAPMRPLAGFIEALVQYSLGAARADLEMFDESGLQARILDAAAVVETESASVYDSARAALEVCALIEGLIGRGRMRRAPQDDAADAEVVPLSDSRAGDEPGGEAGDGDDGDADPEEIDGPGVEFRGELAPDLVHRSVLDGMVGALPQDALAEALPADAANVDAAAVPAPRARPGARGQAAIDVPQSFLYDEWNYRTQAYIKAWCRLYEHRLRGEDFAFIDQVRRRHAELAGQVKRQFSLIRPESWRRMRRMSDGEEFELDSVIEAVIDRRAGHATDEHLYVRRDRGLREVAAAFLVDMSASTDFPLPLPAAERVVSGAEAADHDPYVWGRFGGPVEGAPPGEKRRVIDVAKEALALMSDALRTLGDSHAIYGFSGNGRDNVEFHVAKDFADALSARTWAALAAIEPRGSTRMGPAIRHALAKLARQPVPRKVLIIVSDGYPQDRDYGPDRGDDEYGIQDTAQALREAERAGVSTFCVTIDPAGHDYLRRMCEAHRYMVIDDVAALPGELTKIYRALTA